MAWKTEAYLKIIYMYVSDNTNVINYPISLHYDCVIS